MNISGFFGWNRKDIHVTEAENKKPWVQGGLTTSDYVGSPKLSDFSIKPEVYDFSVPSPTPDLSELRKPIEVINEEFYVAKPMGISLNWDLARKLFIGRK